MKELEQWRYYSSIDEYCQDLQRWMTEFYTAMNNKWTQLLHLQAVKEVEEETTMVEEGKKQEMNFALEKDRAQALASALAKKFYEKQITATNSSDVVPHSNYLSNVELRLHNRRNSSQITRVQEVQHQQSQQQQHQQDADMPIQGRRYILAKPWKRVLAEIIDYGIILIMKILVLFILRDEIGWDVMSVNLLQLMNYQLEALLDEPAFQDSETPQNSPRHHSAKERDRQRQQFNDANLLKRQKEVVRITQELIAMEFVNHLIVFVYEALFIYLFDGSIGKYLMGIRVVACDDLIDLPRHRVEALPGGRLSLFSSCVRSLVKNVSSFVALPFLSITFFSAHYRALHDHVAHTVVVERDRRPRAPAAPAPQ